MGVFQTTFFSSVHSRGKPVDSEWPVPVGPAKLRPAIGGRQKAGGRHQDEEDGDRHGVTVLLHETPQMDERFYSSRGYQLDGL